MTTDSKVQVMSRSVSTKARRRCLDVAAANAAQPGMDLGGTVLSTCRKRDQPVPVAVGGKFAQMRKFDEICTAANGARLPEAVKRESVRCGTDMSKQSVHSGFLAYVFTMP